MDRCLVSVSAHYLRSTAYHTSLDIVIDVCLPEPSQDYLANLVEPADSPCGEQSMQSLKRRRTNFIQMILGQGKQLLGDPRTVQVERQVLEDRLVEVEEVYPDLVTLGDLKHLKHVLDVSLCQYGAPSYLQ